MPDYRETVIRLDHDAKTAEVWTEQRGIKSRLVRAGFKPTGASGKGTWYLGPIKGISFRKPANKHGSRPTDGNLRAGRKPETALT